MELFDLGKFQKFKYFITKYSKTNQKILLSSIVGTDHFSYGNKETWLSMLSNGKRIEKNLRSYLDKPNFFENHDKYNYPHNLSYSTINDSDYYISGSGNHRTIIAKFVFAEQPNKYLNGVNITYHKINSCSEPAAIINSCLCTGFCSLSRTSIIAACFLLKTYSILSITALL